MTGPEHYRRAEALLDSAQVKASEDIDDAGRVVEFYPGDHDGEAIANVLAAAQVHATLADAAATALRVDDLDRGDLANDRSWRAVTT